MDSENEMEKVATNYFRDMFTTMTPSGIEDELAEVPTLVTYQMNESLTAMETEDASGKSPGPGWNDSFFSAGLACCQKRFSGVS